MKPDREALARIRDAIKRGDREIDLGAALGIPLTMVRNADGRVEVRAPDGGEAATAHSQVWDPTPTRPTDYPAGLPFVPNVKAAVVIGSGAHMTSVQWFNPAEPLARLDQLVEESLAEGWELQSAPPRIAERPGEHRWLVQRNRARLFTLVSGSGGGNLLALMQMEHE